jgi:chromate transport protein ChrA
VEFEMDTDPYSNMLPGISNINAARTIGRGVRSGSRGRWLTMAVSLMLILAFVLPVILTIVSQLTR